MTERKPHLNNQFINIPKELEDAEMASPTFTLCGSPRNDGSSPNMRGGASPVSKYLAFNNPIV